MVDILVTKMVDINGLPPLPKCFSEMEVSNLSVPSHNEDVHQSSKDQTLMNGKIEDSRKDDISRVNGVTEETGGEAKPRSPYSRLNLALSKLKEEMVSINLVLYMYNKKLLIVLSCTHWLYGLSCRIVDLYSLMVLYSRI
jgi:hypothetical protein